jgi:hypothetical protein
LTWSLVAMASTTGCSDGNSTISLATRAATINLEAGENVTCTFVNEQRVRSIS